MLAAGDVAEAARVANTRAAEAAAEASQARVQRDRLIRTLSSSHNWSYGKIAAAVGVSRGLVAQICRPGRA